MAFQRKFGSQEERREAARSKLLASTVELIVERGLLGFSLSDVGQRASVSRALPGHHFKSRAEMIQAAVECIFRGGPFAVGVGLSPLVEGLRAMLLKAAGQEPASLALAQLVVGPLPSELASLRDGYRERNIAELARHLEAARRDGQVLEEIDPATVAPILLSQFHAELLRLGAHPGSPEPFLELLVRSLGASPSGGGRKARGVKPPSSPPKPEIQGSLF